MHFLVKDMVHVYTRAGNHDLMTCTVVHVVYINVYRDKHTGTGWMLHIEQNLCTWTIDEVINA